VSISIDAPRHGPLLLTFPKSLDTFRDNWTHEFPSLAGNCILEPTGNVLRVNGEDLSTYEAIAQFLNRVLQTDLRECQTPVWYALRVVDPELVFPREAYYMVALFILGSIVRYEPEMMLEASNPDAEVGWFLRRFLHVAERYFPQLMLMWIEQCPIYFFSAV
jgi:hypothetical protein